jgi:hypothetical protein
MLLSRRVTVLSERAVDVWSSHLVFLPPGTKPHIVPNTAETSNKGGRLFGMMTWRHSFWSGGSAFATYFWRT